MWHYRNQKQKFESELISNCIEVRYTEVDIEASSLHLEYWYDTMVDADDMICTVIEYLYLSCMLCLGSEHWRRGWHLEVQALLWLLSNVNWTTLSAAVILWRLCIGHTSLSREEPPQKPSLPHMAKTDNKWTMMWILPKVGRES